MSLLSAASVLLPVVHAASLIKSSQLSVSISALATVSIAILLIGIAVKKKLDIFQQKTPTPATCSVLQRDDVEERLAETRENLLPIDALVSVKKSVKGLKTGSVLKYVATSNSYVVKLSPSITMTLRAAELQFPLVSGIYVYPVKSCSGISLQEARVTLKGLLHDREWVIIDEKRDKFVSQRRYPQLARIHPKVLPSLDVAQTLKLVLTARGMPDLEVPVVQPGDGQLRLVGIWKDKVEVVDQGDAAAKWLTTFIGEKNCTFRLVRMKEGFTRYTSPKYAPGHATNFADAFPFLLALEESLDELNAALDTPVPMNRFRPNIVLQGSPAFADEQWNCITINGMKFRNVRPCARCSMPNVDQTTGEAHPAREPSQTIVRLRNGARLGFTNGKKFEGYFGSNMVLEIKEGSQESPWLAVGAQVKVLTLKTEIFS